MHKAKYTSSSIQQVIGAIIIGTMLKILVETIHIHKFNLLTWGPITIPSSTAIVTGA